MRNAAISFERVREVLAEAPCAELVGTDDMYIPTTQVRIEPDGEWHRRGPVATETACGLTYFSCASREYALDRCLCRSCFTSRELELAAAAADALAALKEI